MSINDLTITLLALFGVRLIGFIMFLMLFIQKGNRKHLVLCIGWFIYMIGPVPDIINPSQDGLHSFQAFAAATGTFLLMLSVLLYIKTISRRRLSFIIVISISVTAALILLFPEMSGFLATSVQGLFLVGMLFLVIFNRNMFQKSKSSLSFYWLCITLFFGLVHAFGFSFLFKSEPLSVRLLLTLLVNLSFLEFFIYLDWEQAFSRLEQSDKRYRILFDTAPTALFDEDSTVLQNFIINLKNEGIIDIEDYLNRHPERLKEIPGRMHIFNANAKTLELFEASSDEELRNNIDSLFVDDTYQTLLKSMLNVNSNYGCFSFDSTICTLRGRIRDVLIHCSYIEDGVGEPRTMVSMVDITEKNEIQKAIESSLKEKEILLQEVHHRVKNNLTIISSILRLQSQNSDDSMMKDIIRSIENRINTMAIVHEQLYRSRNLKEIDFSEYIKELFDSINTSFSEMPFSINFEYDIAPVYLELNKLIPLGMLINEIVTNSFKHAFGKTDAPLIQIKLTVEEQAGILVVRDNGKGIADDKLFANAESTGFIIINALIHQLNAEIGINRENGTAFYIKIPLFETEKGNIE